MLEGRQKEEYKREREGNKKTRSGGILIFQVLPNARKGQSQDDYAGGALASD